MKQDNKTERTAVQDPDTSASNAAPRVELHPSEVRHKPKSIAIWNASIVRRAIVDAFAKLNPRKMMGNPVMFVVEVGSVVTTILLVRDMLTGHHGYSFNLQITLWLWFTVLFANFAEAMAEGRGKAQAETLRKARSETMANRLLANGAVESVRRIQASYR